MELSVDHYINDKKTEPVYIISYSDASSSHREKNVCYRYSMFIIGSTSLLALICILILTCIWPNHQQNILPTTVPTSVYWKTQTVFLKAAKFTIRVDGKVFQNVSASAYESNGVYSDSGDANYTTFEAIWCEHSVEMRLFIYFCSDGKEWWSFELRIYNGKQNAEWIFFEGVFFKQLLGNSFKEDVEFYDKKTEARLQINQLELQAFCYDLHVL